MKNIIENITKLDNDKCIRIFCLKTASKIEKDRDAGIVLNTARELEKYINDKN